MSRVQRVISTSHPYSSFCLHYSVESKSGRHNMAMDFGNNRLDESSSQDVQQLYNSGNENNATGYSPAHCAESLGLFILGGAIPLTISSLAHIKSAWPCPSNGLPPPKTMVPSVASKRLRQGSIGSCYGNAKRCPLFHLFLNLRNVEKGLIWRARPEPEALNGLSVCAVMTSTFYEARLLFSTSPLPVGYFVFLRRQACE